MFCFAVYNIQRHSRLTFFNDRTTIIILFFTLVKGQILMYLAKMEELCSCMQTSCSRYKTVPSGSGEHNNTRLA